jgi:hypothetical protein
VGTSRNNLAHIFTYFTNFEVLTTRCFENATLFKFDAMHMLVQYGLMMHVRMARLPICIDDWNAIISREGILCDKLPSHNQDT